MRASVTWANAMSALILTENDRFITEMPLRNSKQLKFPFVSACSHSFHPSSTANNSMHHRFLDFGLRIIAAKIGKCPGPIACRCM